MTNEQTLPDTKALDALCFEIIDELDSYAREYDNYEYGLPVFSQLDEMRDIIKPLIQKFLQNDTE